MCLFLVLNLIGFYQIASRNYYIWLMVGIIFIQIPYIIDGTTLCLCSLASYYHSTVHFNPLQSNKSSMHYSYMTEQVINDMVMKHSLSDGGQLITGVD